MLINFILFMISLCSIYFFSASLFNAASKSSLGKDYRFIFVTIHYTFVLSSIVVLLSAFWFSLIHGVSFLNAIIEVLQAVI